MALQREGEKGGGEGERWREGARIIRYSTRLCTCRAGRVTMGVRMCGCFKESHQSAAPTILWRFSLSLSLSLPPPLPLYGAPAAPSPAIRLPHSRLSPLSPLPTLASPHSRLFL